MEMLTAISYVLFLLACFGLVWGVICIAIKCTTLIAKATIAAAKGEGRVTWNFKMELWLVPLCFTVIMGYIFIL